MSLLPLTSTFLHPSPSLDRPLDPLLSTFLHPSPIPSSPPRQLLEISATKPNRDYSSTLSVAAHVGGKLAPANTAASSINRRKADDTIAQQNLAIYKRLQVCGTVGVC